MEAMMKAKIENECYKALIMSDKRTLSSLVMWREFNVLYPRSLWVYPKIAGTPLFTFKDLGATIGFAEPFLEAGHIVIYRCEYEKLFDSPHNGIMLATPGLYSVSELYKFWSEDFNHDDFPHQKCYRLPYNTLLVTGIRLAEKVIDYKKRN
jgi:hypothetical protein